MTNPNEPKTTSLLSDRVYDRAKFIALIVLPAAGSLYFGLASIWGLPNAEQVVGTITVLDTFLGVVLGLSTSSYNKSDAKYDGAFAIVEDEEGSTLRLRNVDYDALMTKNELMFKLDQ